MYRHTRPFPSKTTPQKSAVHYEYHESAPFWIISGTSLASKSARSQTSFKHAPHHQ